MSNVDVVTPNPGAIAPTNPLDKKPSPEAGTFPDFTIEEQNYLTYLNIRLRNAKEMRNQQWQEFSRMTYLQNYENNEKVANTYIEPKTNPEDPVVSSGTIQTKLNTLVSHIVNLNLTAEVIAFAKGNKKLADLGKSFTDIMDITAEHDGGTDGGDEEKKLHRILELLKQGTVFVQEQWVVKRQMKKELKTAYKGSFRDFGGYTEKLVTVFEGPGREVMYAPNVYLGDITKFSMSDQPFIFTVEQMSYDKAKEIYGQFENFEKYVKAGMPPSSVATSTGDSQGNAQTIYDAKFRLTQLQSGDVEIIKYQDEGRDEFQIEINAIPMLPIGFPLSAVTPAGKFNITKQVLFVKNSQFAYGGSFVTSASLYELSRQIDEMIRLFVLKTRKSITPPYINTSSKIVSKRSLLPGNISQGIPPNALIPIGTESQGVTTGEFQMYNELQRQVEQATVSDVFQGQQARSGTTATEILEVQRQARISLGLIVLAASLLETKIGYLRLWNILGKYIEPIGRTVRGDKDVLKFRAVSRDIDLPGEGKGERRTLFTDQALPAPEIVEMLNVKKTDEAGYPVKHIYISIRDLKAAMITWRISTVAKEKDSSPTRRLLFREQLGDVLALMQIGFAPATHFPQAGMQCHPPLQSHPASHPHLGQ